MGHHGLALNLYQRLPGYLLHPHLRGQEFHRFHQLATRCHDFVQRIAARSGGRVELLLGQAEGRQGRGASNWASNGYNLNGLVMGTVWQAFTETYGKIHLSFNG